MNKTELVAAIAEEAGLTKADAARALDAAVSTVTKALSS
ncbi:MAG: HU family DNA-binding protein, partial [Thiotrichales bacterium]|nr:HU family DNA-binding protein [Thiotrichales bacterium]